MKTKILKMILPVFVLMLAVVSAFAFKNIEDKALLAPETGWINLPDNPCDVSVECDTNPGPICTTVHNGITYQAFGKVTPSMACSKVLNRKN